MFFEREDAQGKRLHSRRRRQAGEFTPLPGGTMAVYEHVNDEDNHMITFNETEKHIYGSSRLGMHNEHIPLFDTQNKTYSMASVQHHIGDRTYELSNHLGNVLSVISDKPIPHDNSGTVDYFLADIRHAQDYSPFGVTLHKRDFSLTTSAGTAVPYRYGFNGMEMDNEIKDGGNSYTTEFRQYDTRIGRFFAIDPLADQFPAWSPYTAFSDNPIKFIDPDGRAPKDVLGESDNSSASKPIKSINFGLFTLTFRKGERSDVTGLPKRSVDFDWNYTFSRETKTKTRWKTDRFVINNMDYSGLQNAPNIVNYAPTTVGTATNLTGQSLNDATADLAPKDYVVEKVKLKTKVNDHGGDSFYQFNVGGQVVNHQNNNRVSLLNPASITPGSNINGALFRQTPAADGFFDSCDGYKLIVRVQYKSVRTVKRLRIVRRAPD